MYRRRRPHREIEFSFDSFLDVVANVVGIILRLILVAWAAGRGYQYVVPPPPLPPIPEMALPEEPPLPTDPRRETFAAARERIERERSAERAKIDEAAVRHAQAVEEEKRLAEVAEMRERLAGQEAALAKAGAGVAARLRASSMTTAQLQERSKQLLAALEAAKKLPPKRKELRYHTPVAAEVQTEEVMFEIKAGRVTLIDTASLLAKAKAAMTERVKELETGWEFTGTTPVVGAFRMRYVVERERTSLDGPGAGGPVGGTFRYGFTGWEVMPLSPTRGEAEDVALRDGSAFRRVTDALDPRETVVTLWVYPDSFPLYRRLRDHLHAKELVVAGRPLPEGTPIASSRGGTASRGQ